MKIWAIVCMVMGGLIAVGGFLNLQKSGLSAYHQNAFALKQSGYGMILARLGQMNLDRAWHYGAVASESSQRGREAGRAASGGGDEDAIDVHAGHNHDKEDAGGHEDSGNWVSPALEFLVDLDAERFRRTTWDSWSEQLQEAVGRDIENILLRGYNMDPSDYGVYNAYFHFLMYHETRRRDSDRNRAYQMSEYTIQVASKNNEDPMPWLTATMATLNQFFMHQQDYRKEKGDLKVMLPGEVIVKYQDRIKYCLGHYYKLRNEAIEKGRWQKLTEARREEADGRAEIGKKLMNQFQVMIDRNDKRRGQIKGQGTSK